MPSYYFHLKFELLSQPLLPRAASAQSSAIYLPPRNTDIFLTPLPVHQISSWSSPVATSIARSRAKSVVPDVETPQPQSTLPGPNHERRHSQYSSQPHGPKPTFVVGAHSPPNPSSSVTVDWRFGAVSILSIDMNPLQSDRTVQGTVLDTTSHVGLSSGGIATRARFIPSDPKNTEVGWGVVHLYREAAEASGLYTTPPSSSQEEGSGEVNSTGGKGTEDCTTLCILAVPSYMTPSDLLGYVGEQTREDVSHFRLVRTERANKYMVLMKFRTADKAKNWQGEWNGKPFNSMEPENCHAVFIKSVEFLTANPNNDPKSFPEMSNDPFTPAARSKAATLVPNSLTPSDTKAISSPLTAKPLAPPTPALVELPTCPVCLERMDESTGLLTILCQHVFHCACLEKWRGSGCPVCRYTQNDPVIGTRHGDSNENIENECSICGSTSNLWICLICGNTGCGRYDDAHAFAHYEATSHSYAMDISTQRVWDYVGDGYVHRLVQNKSDGKLVDLPDAYSHPSNRSSNLHANAQLTAYAADTVPREKLDNMGMEYTYLLTSQLESQRSYFEEQLERAVDKAAKAASIADEASKSLGTLSAKLTELEVRHDEALSSIRGLETSLEKQNTRSAATSELARKMTRQYQEEKTINGALMDRIHHIEGQMKESQEKLEHSQLEKQDLEEQNRDLTFFISGQQKLKELEEAGDLAKDELEEGTVEVGAKKGRKRKGKEKK